MQESLEWNSVVNSILDVNIRTVLTTLDQHGVIAYTDGACIKNPGGPAGWSALFWALADAVDGKVRKGAPCLECYGHIPRAQTTTNNRAEISAVLAVLSLAPPALPLTIYSDSEYTIKVAQGTYEMKANSDLWVLYRKLLSYRKQPPTFIWVRGHAGQEHNERADELAGLGAFNGDLASYQKWQEVQSLKAQNQPKPVKKALPADVQVALRVQVQRLQAYFDTVSVDSAYVSQQERKFIQDMTKRLQKKNFALSEKQINWIKGLVAKHKISS